MLVSKSGVIRFVAISYSPTHLDIVVVGVSSVGLVVHSHISRRLDYNVAYCTWYLGTICLDVKQCYFCRFLCYGTVSLRLPKS